MKIIDKKKNLRNYRKYKRSSTFRNYLKFPIYHTKKNFQRMNKISYKHKKLIRKNWKR